MQICRSREMFSLALGALSDAEQQVRDIVGEIVMALDESNVTSDTDHKFMSSKTLVKIVPAVVYRAHERCKHLGKKLEGE